MAKSCIRYHAARKYTLTLLQWTFSLKKIAWNLAVDVSQHLKKIKLRHLWTLLAISCRDSDLINESFLRQEGLSINQHFAILHSSISLSPDSFILLSHSTLKLIYNKAIPIIEYWTIWYKILTTLVWCSREAVNVNGKCIKKYMSNHYFSFTHFYTACFHIVMKRAASNKSRCWEHENNSAKGEFIAL